MNRREFLNASAATATAMGLGATATALATTSAPAARELRIQSAQYLIGDAPTQNMVSLSPDQPPPVLRFKRNTPFVANVTNAHTEYTAMHWHGLRVPNKMDGVPYLTQWPIAPGETRQYAFTSEDAGTYWYHPHCMTMEQMARGLTGVLIVEEDDDVGVDGETVLNLRDFRLGNDGQFLKFSSRRRAARSGTLGTVMTANWKRNPVYDHASGSLVRLRLAATDTTRIYNLFLKGAAGSIVAADGHPLREPISWPTETSPYPLGPGQRLDIVVRMPDQEGNEVVLCHKSAQATRPLATLRSIGSSVKRTLQELRKLPPNPVPQPDLKDAQTVEFVFGWSPQAQPPKNGFCGSLGVNFWSINRTPWAGDAADGTKPLATLDLGKSYIIRLRNESPNLHPIHLHGLTFRPVRSNLRPILSNWTDTALLQKNETMDVALVASNPGDWAFHCHVIEHQKTGLAGFIRVA